MQRFLQRRESAPNHARYIPCTAVNPAEARRIRLRANATVRLQKQRPRPLTTFATFFAHGLIPLRQGLERAISSALDAGRTARCPFRQDIRQKKTFGGGHASRVIRMKVAFHV
jgi:hypothetical protein